MSLWRRLTAPFRRAPKPGSPGPSAAVVPALPLSYQASRIGGGLTPSDVSNILYQADAGDISRLVELTNESRQKDGHLHAVLRTRENALSSLPLVVAPHVEAGEREPSPRDAEVAQFVETALRDASGDGETLRSFADLVPHLQGGVLHGFAVAETAWEVRAGKLVPSGWRPVNQRRFGWRSSDGRLSWYEGTSKLGDGALLQERYPGQFVQHMPRENGDIAAREGLSRVLIWCALFRNWTIADWLKLAELSWKPWRIGTYSKGAGEHDRDDLLEVLQYLTTNGIAVMREDQKLDIHYPSGGSGGGGTLKGNHQSLAEFMAAEMSKAVIGQTLTTDAGNRGARSLGEVHERVRQDIRDQDAIAVAATIRRDIVAPLVALNFGDMPLPSVAFATEDTVDLKAFSEAITGLKAAGVRIPVRWVHDQTGIPEPSEDDKVLGEDEVEVDTSELADELPPPPAAAEPQPEEPAPDMPDMPAEPEDETP
jgi:phage gp29-like protein